MPELHPDSQLFWDLTRHLTDEDEVLTVVDRLGHSRPDKGFDTGVLSTEFSDLRRATRQANVQRLEQKLIRRRGHYTRPPASAGAHPLCRRYYFDGTLCKHEVHELVADYVSRTYGSSQPAFLLREDGASDWLLEPLGAIAVGSELQLYRVSDDIDPSLYLGKEASPPLLVCEMVDTGETLRGVLQNLRVRHPQLRLRVMSVLGTSESKEFVIRVGDAGVDVPYLLRVDQEHRIPGSQCEMCRLDIPWSREPSADDYVNLTSYDFWSMARDGGLREYEKDVPPHRRGRTKDRGLRLVPDFPAIVKANGAWLAAKIRQRVEREVTEWPVDTMLVCPLDEEGSTVLSDTLHRVLATDVVQVPRGVIQECAQHFGTPNMSRIRDQHGGDEWFQKLTRCADRMVVLDEFTVSGRTFLGIYALLGLLGKQILCCVALCDFGPDVDRASEQLAAFPVHSLYKWQRTPLTQRVRG